MKDVLNYLDSLLQDHDNIIVATSGGPDSMCLLHLLCEFKSKYHLNLVVAHVNHKLRKESDQEALFVKNVCLQYDLIYEYMEIHDYGNNNIENEAREKRYQFFYSLARKYHAKYIMTAHHGDDLMETILMRLVRGSSLKGYSGFHKEVDFHELKIVRPLIFVTKSEIESFMKEKNYSYVIDESNFSDEITRNRYRKHVLPFLKEEQKNVHHKFLKFSEELTEANLFIDHTVKECITNIQDEKGIKISKLLQLDKFLIKKVIEYMLSLIYVDDLFLISNKHTELIISLIKSDKSNLSIQLPNNVCAIKEYDYFRIVKEQINLGYSYEFHNEIKLPNRKVIKQISTSDSKSNNVIRLNSKDITLPLVVRTRLEGDKIAVKHLNGTKKVKDIFIDEKISIEDRKTIPIVTDSKNNILWIAGVKKSKFDIEKEGIYDIILSYEEEI